MIDDLESFINEQKAKLSQEKKDLHNLASLRDGVERERPIVSVPTEDNNRRNEMRLETQRKYQAFMDQLAGSMDTRMRPPEPEEGLASKLGGYAEKRQRLMAQKRDDYNRYLAEINFRGPNQGGIHGHRKNGDLGGSLPGLRNDPSAEMQKVAERNREYNEMLQNQKSPRTSRRDSESPALSYAEILQKKRAEERNYRHRNDPEFFENKASFPNSSYNKLSGSEGNIDRINSEGNLKIGDQISKQKKVKFNTSTVNADVVKPGTQPQYSDRNRGYGLDDQHFNATLLIGERSNDDDSQKKAAYREELQRQMAETKAQRQKEKLESLEDSGGDLLNRDSARRPTSWPKENVSSAHLRDDGRTPQSPRSGVGPPPQFDDGKSRFKSDDILSNGFQFDRRLKPRQNHPSFFPLGVVPLTAPSLMPYNSQVGSDYFYYGNQNPLDPMLAASGSGADVPFIPVHGNATSVLPSGGKTPYAHQSVALDRAPPGTLGIAENDEQRKYLIDERKRQYQRELQRQMADAELKKTLDKEERDRYDRKMERETADYNPYGRDGGGAPVKDIFGNVVTSRSLGSLLSHDRRPVGYTDLHKMRRSDLTNTDDFSSDVLNDDVEKSGGNYARGGHGIFGEPMTQEQKNSRLKYQKELRLQMEEKRLRLEKEREKMKKEDELLEQKIREDAMKAEQEKEETARREKEKMEKLKQDLLGRKLEAEERKIMEEERKRRKEEQEELARQKSLEEQRNLKDEEESRRIKSPPISSTHIAHQKENLERPLSPPIPARRTRSQQSQISNSVVLENLANFGKKLHLEQRNVEMDLKRLQYDRENPDDRLILLPQNTKSNYDDIFELAKTGRPASMRRMPGKEFAHPNRIRVFNNILQNRNDNFVQPLSESHTNVEELERSQRAVLVAQQRELAELKREAGSTSRLATRSRTLRTPPLERSSDLLNSHSDFIEFPILDIDADKSYFSNRQRQNLDRRPDDLRTDKYKSREPPKRLDSFTSLDLQELTRSNDDRDKRLRSLAGDDLSNGGYDDVLNRFVAQNTTPRRPPSNDTLNDSSWMRSTNGR